MKKNNATEKILLEHFNRYPELQIRDLLKFLYQSSFGCEHLISSLNSVTDCIIKEAADLKEVNNHLIDKLDGDYSRVHLSYLKKGLSAVTLGKLFYLSSKTEPDGLKNLKEKLNITKNLINDGLLPFSTDDFSKAVNEWSKNDYPAVHHSEKFRNKYNPSYRVIADRYVPFLPLFARIDKICKKNHFVIAIDGRSTSGKSYLSKILNDLYDCNIIHMDDFFLRPEQRNKQRLNEVGGNIDRERFLQEILIPLSQNRQINYRKYNCSSMKIDSSVVLKPKRLTIIEGVYSMHKGFVRYYDLTVFLNISEDLQKQRLIRRNSPEVVELFYKQWIPLEEIYFSETGIKQRSDLIINIEE
ncbi:MAG: uridine kinase family protein [Erysipelotrichaceae bacterium]|jgi:uridine kinase